MKIHQKFKVLLVTVETQSVLIYDGKNLIDFDYINHVENGRFCLQEVNENKNPINSAFT